MRFNILIIILLIHFFSCGSRQSEYRTYQGEVFGTYYRIQVGDIGRDFQTGFDSVFALVNYACNSYVQESEISNFNCTGKLVNPSATFGEMMDSVAKFHRLSGGAFEPTLFPLIKSWGFSFEQKESMDSAKVANLLQLVGFEDNILKTDSGFWAKKEGVKLDITGLGEGYTLDKLAQVLDKNGVSDYMVEIGGEMKAKGKNPRGETWMIGIEDPLQVELGNMGILLTKVALDNRAISSSGTYRKFYVDGDGNRRPHILDPLTGYPVSHSMVSVSVLSSSATESDALATAFMSMGPERANILAESLPGVEAMFVIGEKGSLSMEFTSGFPKPE